MSKKNQTISRRGFLGKGALLGTGLGLIQTEQLFAANSGKILKNSKADTDYLLNDTENFIYSVCLNCNTGCGIKCKIQDGVLVKIDGNPYNPWTMVPHLPMKTNTEEAAQVDAGLCPKGQAGLQIAYDPYRIRKVLKRAGKRGENKWISIPFDQAITEIAEGGKIFTEVPGEENRNVEGLRTVMALTDKIAAREMAKRVKIIWDTRDMTKKVELVDQFKIDFKEHLQTLIDPAHPDLGPKNNQFVMAWGRLKNGRKEFISRLGEAYGTTNLHGHTTVCQGSLYFTCKAISEQYIGGKFSGGSKFYWQSDIEHARYILFVGANLFDANYGPTNRTVRLTKNLEKGYTKIAVADPRFSKLASKAETWLPIKPGEDAALALAIIQWMIENERIDKQFLANANKAAAIASGEPSWTNASLLVEIKDGTPGNMLRAADLGLCSPDKKKLTDGTEYEEKYLVALAKGKPVKVDPNDEDLAIYGDLFVDVELSKKDGSKVKARSALQLLKEEAGKNTLAGWCELAGLKEKDVVKVARELTSYGKQASVDIHRGVAQHTNGFYNVFSWMSVNMLLGNYDWQGGMSKASTYKYDGSGGGKFNLNYNPGKIQTFGVSSIRHDIAYEQTTLFGGYPAKRNWFPLSSDIYEEIIPSIGEAYPYPVKALFMYMGAPTYSLPAGHTNIDVLADVEKLPLFFASDILIGPTSMYADYIFPDLSYLERWEFQGSHPNMIYKVENIRQPVIPPIPETVKVYGEEMPISLESTLMALSEKLGLNSFGKNALGEGIDFTRPEDLYLRGVANIALNGGPGNEVPDAGSRELEVFSKARRHLTHPVFDEPKWKSIVGEELWPKVVYLLNRGGRFAEAKTNADGKLTNKYGALLNLYQEKTAGYNYSGTGKPYSGLAQYIPQKNYEGKTLEYLGNGYDLHLITSRTITQTKSRTIAAYWLQGILPENAIIINRQDAEKLGFDEGETARIVSATNTGGKWDFKNGHTKDIIGKIKITEAIRPGVISFYLGFGHWASGAGDVEINGETVKGDPRRAKGFHANAAMWTDSSLKDNTCLIDPVGGSVSFYDTKVNLIKV
ncbi:MAG: molybdopterin-dependent oxidoreductase [Bacteroidales bacterium]|nr:molybdopterin-dependent oxidoreductase [Bacteroidales bacterium]